MHSRRHASHDSAAGGGDASIIATLILHLPVGVLLLALDGALTYANDAARDFGRRRVRAQRRRNSTPS